MFWKKKPSNERYQSEFDAIVLAHRASALEKLEGNVSPALFALFWALALELLRKQGAKALQLSAEDDLKIQQHADESFVVEAMAGFGSMDSKDIENAKTFFHSVRGDVSVLLDMVWHQKISLMEALNAWSKRESIGAAVLQDERMGPVALICCVSIFEQALLKE